jgi:hypothetical protein
MILQQYLFSRYLIIILMQIAKKLRTGAFWYATRSAFGSWMSCFKRNALFTHFNSVVPRPPKLIIFRRKLFAQAKSTIIFAQAFCLPAGKFQLRLEFASCNVFFLDITQQTICNIFYFILVKKLNYTLVDPDIPTYQGNFWGFSFKPAACLCSGQIWIFKDKISLPVCEYGWPDERIPLRFCAWCLDSPTYIYYFILVSVSVASVSKYGSRSR